MARIFYLTEIGFDTSTETESSLIEAAQTHCKETDRSEYLPIDTVEKAIEYFTNNGFKVIERTSHITKIAYIETTDISEYSRLDNLGILLATDYGTTEISVDSIRDGFKYFTGSEEEYNELLEKSIGEELLTMLEQEDIDFIMVV